MYYTGYRWYKNILLVTAKSYLAFSKCLSTSWPQRFSFVIFFYGCNFLTIIDQRSSVVPVRSVLHNLFKWGLGFVERLFHKDVEHGCLHGSIDRMHVSLVLGAARTEGHRKHIKILRNRNGS